MIKKNITMKGNLNKSYDFSYEICKEDIISLIDVIVAGCEEFSFDFTTKDGAEYTVDNIEDVLNYSNPDTRKIVKLSIKGNVHKGNNFIFPNILISLYDSAIYDSSYLITFRQLEEKDIVFYTERIDELIKRTKRPYYWVHKSAFYWCTGIVLYIILAVIFLMKTNNADTAAKVYNILVLQGVSALCMLFSIHILKKIISYLYPKSCFCIGEQEKQNNKKQKLRSVAFYVIISTILLGVLSGIITHFVVNKWF